MPEDQKTTLDTTLQEQLQIDEGDIFGELQRQPARFFFWSSQWVKAARSKRKQRLRIKEIEATLANELRRQVAENDAKARVTEAMLNNYLYAHPTFLTEERELIEAEFREEMLEVAKDSFKQRGLALQELARQQRDEKIYGDEFKLMEKEYDTRQEDKKRQAKRRIAKTVETPTKEAV